MMQYAIELALKDMRYSVKNLTEKENYQNDKGKYVPSVTEIIHAMIHKDTLMNWANALGLRGIRYTNYMNAVSALGTEAHSAIEKFIKTKEKTESNIPFQGFLLWYESMIESGHTIEILGSEMHMCCRWFGGTCDMLARIDGKVYIIDFKTSNYINSGYFLQLAGYKYLIESTLNIVIDGGFIVLQLNKKEVGFDEYILLADNWDHAQFIEKSTIGFLSLVYAYYHVVEVNNVFHRIFDGQEGGKIV